MQDLLNRALTGLRHEPIERRVRASLDGRTVVDSTRAMLVWEPRRVCPTYAVPAEDITAALAPAPAANAEAAGVLHPGIPFSVHTAAGDPLSIDGRDGLGFRFADPDLAGYVELDFAAFDAWYEENELVISHPRDPYHRIDVRESSRPVRIELDGEVVAETTRARLLFETRLPTRFYLPREDVRAELHPTARRTRCAYKGEASWWSVDGHENLGWSYERPVADMTMIAGLVAFWDEKVDVFVDGELRERPGSVLSKTLVEEFA